jgi:ATP-binding cassette subfamily B multidrug efflux pump
MAARALVRYLGGQRGRYAAGLVLLAATNLCALAIPWAIKETIEGIAGAGARGAAAWGAAVVATLAVLQGVIRVASRLCLLGAAQRVEARIRDDLFERLLGLPAAFYAGQRTGDLMSRATADLQSVTALLGFGLLTLVNTAILYAGTLLAMLRLDPWLTTVALAPYPVLVVLARRFTIRAHHESLAVQEQLAAVSSRAQENLGGMTVVRAYTTEAHEIAAFGRLNAELLRRACRQVRTQAGFGPIMGAVGGLGALTVLWVGGAGVIEGRLTLGAFVAFSSYLAYLAWPTLALGWVLVIVRRGLTAMERILEVLEAPAPAAPAALPTPPLPVRGELEVRELTFRYRPDGPPVLAGVSLAVRAGAWVALVGPTGAGKTTLVSLLPRLWDPPPGTVLLDGRDVLAYPREALRRAIGYVPQEAFLFSRSLADNVRLDDPGVRLDEVGPVAGLDDELARLPQGWDTVVGERGLTLSGGQRQRVTLARALARDPAVLLLDDAFAAVDAEREATILTRLRERRRGRTTLIATHRLRAAELADLVVVLDDGRVVEQGTHAELLGRGGLYARLWRRHQLEATLEGVAP